MGSHEKSLITMLSIFAGAIGGVLLVLLVLELLF
jgi:hypothetical protein